MNPYLSVIIPAYNEEKRLPKTLESVFKYLNKQAYAFEVIVVDDGSADKTTQNIKDFSKDIKIVSYLPNRGKGYAVKTGMLKAIGEWRLFMDADNSTPISEIAKLWPYAKEFDVVIGSRYLDKKILRKQPLFRRVLSRVANMVIRVLLLPEIQDTQCGFKLFNKKATKIIFPLTSIERWGFDFDVLAIARKKKLKIKEVGICWKDADSSHVRAAHAALATLKELLKVRRKIKGIE